MNVTSADLTIRGLGPSFDASGRPLVIDADEVSIDVPFGIVLQDTGLDGRVEFVALSQGELFRMAVSVDRAVERDTEVDDPNGDTFESGDGFDATGILIRPRVAELAEASTAEEVLPLLLDVPVVKALQGTVTADVAVTVGEEADDRVLPSDFANLDDAYLLGDPAAQPSSFGGEEAGEPAFDYWVETLSL